MSKGQLNYTGYTLSCFPTEARAYSKRRHTDPKAFDTYHLRIVTSLRGAERFAGREIWAIAPGKTSMLLLD